MEVNGYKLNEGAIHAIFEGLKNVGFSQWTFIACVAIVVFIVRLPAIVRAHGENKAEVLKHLKGLEKVKQKAQVQESKRLRRLSEGKKGLGKKGGKK